MPTQSIDCAWGVRSSSKAAISPPSGGRDSVTRLAEAEGDRGLVPVGLDGQLEALIPLEVEASRPDPLTLAAVSELDPDRVRSGSPGGAAPASQVNGAPGLARHLQDDGIGPVDLKRLLRELLAIASRIDLQLVSLLPAARGVAGEVRSTENRGSGIFGIKRGRRTSRGQRRGPGSG